MSPDTQKKILVVDDELLIRDLLYDHFASRDYQISTAESAEKALEILEGDHDGCPTALLEDLLQMEWDALIGCMAPERPFSALARQIITRIRVGMRPR